MDRRLDRDWTQPVRYPDPAVEVIDKRFHRYRLGSATVERLHARLVAKRAAKRAATTQMTTVEYII